MLLATNYIKTQFALRSYSFYIWDPTHRRAKIAWRVHQPRGHPGISYSRERLVAARTPHSSVFWSQFYVASRQDTCQRLLEAWVTEDCHFLLSLLRALTRGTSPPIERRQINHVAWGQPNVWSKSIQSMRPASSYITVIDFAKLLGNLTWPIIWRSHSSKQSVLPLRQC